MHQAAMQVNSIFGKKDSLLVVFSLNKDKISWAGHLAYELPKFVINNFSQFNTCIFKYIKKLAGRVIPPKHFPELRFNKNLILNIEHALESPSCIWPWSLRIIRKCNKCLNNYIREFTKY